MSFCVSKERMLEGIHMMNSFGTRLTGSKGHNDFIKWLKAEIAEMDIPTFSDPFYFTRWEEKNSSVEIIDGDEKINIPVSSAYPYSGKTSECGITEELVFVKNIKDAPKTAGKIAVFNISNINFLPSEIAFNKRSSYPQDVVLEKKYEGPVITSFVQCFYGILSKLTKAKAVILIWKGLHDEMIQGQYLSFIMDYQNIPMLWINETNGKKVIQAAKEHKKAKFVLEAETQEHAFTESFYCIIEGKNKKENIIVNTHTDGTNCVEENGPIALLELMRNMKKSVPERTHIFVFTTGHFRLPHFEDKRTGGFQSGSRWLAGHRELWDGKGDHFRCIANLTLEHLGCKEWRDIDGEYKYTGKPEIDLVYTGNKFMDKLYIDTVKDRKVIRTMTLRGHNALHFGEGQNFFTMGIPEISLVPAPYYLCVVSDSHEMEKFDIDLMTEQTETFARLIEKLENISAKELGRSDFYSILKAKSVSGGYDFSVKGLISKIKSGG
ncbi:MAG: hypothetical protein IKJ88_06310 [Clostridia bacterium]|nr:hypothetical protein [Clostridia bacterium]MBR3975458.1 hypothetical protein [Clostridia bacterium]